MRLNRYLQRPGTSYLLSLVLVLIFSGVVAAVRLVAEDVGNASMLYLLAVLTSAVAFGSGPAILASLASFVAFNFFFVQPRYTFRVADTDQWVALTLLLVTGVVTGQLAATVRDRARQAERREKEAVVLFDVVRLMAQPELDDALKAIAERIRLELGLAAVLLVFRKGSPTPAEAEAGDPEALGLARSAVDLSEMILTEGSTPTAQARGAPGRWIRVISPQASRKRRSDRTSTVPVSLQGQRVGSIVLVRKIGSAEFTARDDRLLSAIANQLGLALERLRLHREATEAETLRRTDELRAALINAVSHDLRTPLSSIIASAGSLQQQDVTWTEGEKREFARAIVEEAERLNRLVGNLLDLSRIEAGSIRPEKGWYDFGSLVSEVTGRLARLTADRKMTLDVPEDLPPVYCDYVEIDQVLSNLVENAARYTPTGGEIIVAVRLTGHEVQVEVADTGAGIPTGAPPHLFKPFYHAPGTGARPPGAGLGLAVAKGLVEAHGGRIWAENRRKGGARFVFTLPLTEGPAAGG